MTLFDTSEGATIDQICLCAASESGQAAATLKTTPSVPSHQAPALQYPAPLPGNAVAVDLSRTISSDLTTKRGSTQC